MKFTTIPNVSMETYPELDPIHKEELRNILRQRKFDSWGLKLKLRLDDEGYHLVMIWRGELVRVKLDDALIEPPLMHVLDDVSEGRRR